ncbi:MAG TPA: PDZ domain-containing protein, partial [Candidatus Paceibacterota bacterium]|nr:PDZ domain-containing protein [Candidatus Paceibacterota bacterium]
DGWFASTEPAFSSDGKYLFFVSNRSFAPRYSQTEWNHAYFDMARIFLVTLAADTPSPLAPKSDEVKTGAGPDPAGRAAGSEPKVSSAPGEAKPESGAAASRSPAAVRVDYDGLPDRIAVLPIAASSYRDLASAGDKLFYTRQGLRDERRRLLMFDLGKEKETDLGEIQEYRLAAHRQKMLVRMDNAYAIVDLPAARIEVKERLKLGGLQVQLDRPAEWRQIFVECWRQMRDFVFDPHLHAVDWTAMRARYEPLLEHVHHRMDLTYLIGEMIGEINLGHCYVGGGDYPKAERIALGLLGADWERDAVSGYWRIARILPGQNWDSSLRSPLTEIGVGVKAGDYVIEIDGRRTDRLANPNTALVNTAGRPVVLRVHSEPRLEGSRTCTVIPIADDRPLRYFGWVQRNLERVSKATDGRIGYVHIPNMGVDGLNEFVKLYYPQTHKQGLIVDVRGNGGGNVSPQIIERLRREWVMVTVARNAAVNIDPTGMVLGPKVMLLDEFSASDGDIVAYRFRHYGLGPIIGKRSWGGVVGIRGSLPLLDGGYLNRPEYSRYDIAGREWIMEGRGVEPDIRVDNDPAREFAGQDDQLERAIAVILEKLEQEPVRIPPPPPWPDKSR